ncbi:MAG: sigma-70 family RNA polymerase sigma factor [Rhodothermales bacterium]
MAQTPQRHDVTRVLVDASAGDPAAANRLWSMVYDELRLMARRRLRGERAGHTLSTTALVHEAYLRLFDPAAVDWKNRAHFFGVAARAMRHILVDHARQRKALKRGGGQRDVTLDENAAQEDEQIEDIIALDTALNQLEKYNERWARVVECRYFGGLTSEETAKVLGIASKTVERDWKKARAWLFRALADQPEPATAVPA